MECHKFTSCVRIRRSKWLAVLNTCVWVSNGADKTALVGAGDHLEREVGRPKVN